MNIKIFDEEKTFLLRLARQTLEHYFQTESLLQITESDLSFEVLKEKYGVFVTLHKGEKKELRGCIGHIIPYESLYKETIINALNAAFNDPRFDPLTENELNDIDIEISILSIPQILPYTTTNDLLDKLIPHEHGVIIKKGYNEATFLAQVWEQFPDKKTFLSHLCLKAGLAANTWEREKIEVKVYETLAFSEKNFGQIKK